MYTSRFPAVLAAATLMCAAAHAGDSGFYLGAGVGEATQNNDAFDGEDTSFRWLAGYSFSKYFAAEAGFVDGGTQKDNVGGLRVTSSADGTFAAVLAKLPLGRVFTPYAKVGYVFYDATSTVSNGAVTASASDSDDDLLFGGGVEFRLGESLRLRADYEKIDVPDIAFDVYSVIVTYQF
ncbi:MAG TPA: porin family protein [Steroidobacteraceae bacterium]|nr:porin family protein [Steroidobacteraceae bacterium]